MDKEEIREKALSQAREKVSERDRISLMIKAVKALSAIEETSPDRIDVLRDWYSLHFPELEKELEDEDFLSVLSRGIGREDLEAFQEIADNSAGMKLGEDDKNIIQVLLDSINRDNELKQSLKEYISETAEDEVPNLSVLLGPVLAARILGLAGGLDDLARKPASTVQMLGAEKALFRHLKKGDNPPKHGIIFEHEFVNSLEPDKRGKMARFLANKTVIAARMDNYGEKRKGEDLREECRKKFEELN